MEVVCIEDVYGDDGKLWCRKGTLYSAIELDNGDICIPSQDEDFHPEHRIYCNETDDLNEFYEKHFLKIIDYVE